MLRTNDQHVGVKMEKIYIIKNPDGSIIGSDVNREPAIKRITTKAGKKWDTLKKMGFTCKQRKLQPDNAVDAEICELCGPGTEKCGRYVLNVIV
jgi:hypothetical protein